MECSRDSLGGNQIEKLELIFDIFSFIVIAGNCLVAQNCRHGFRNGLRQTNNNNNTFDNNNKKRKRNKNFW